jgi:glycosyltransferase involved in cell wall biosynthesis
MENAGAPPQDRQWSRREPSDIDGKPEGLANGQRANQSIAAVIPAFNEEKHIADVVRRTRTKLDNVLVVDDGSSDATAERAREGGAEVVVHPQNLGKGEAIRNGLRHWLDRQFEWVLILDADAQHRPEEIDRFVEAAVSAAKPKLILGNRMDDVSAMPLVRRMVNRYMSNKISQVCGQIIPDTQCGFRMIHRQLIPDLLDGADRFDYETEMLIVASRKGFRIDSVPISTVYSDEVSSIHPVRDTLRFFKLMRRYKKL